MGNFMPVISLDIMELDKGQKEQLVKEFTEIASRVTGIPADLFYVFINESKKENIGVGGVLLSNKWFFIIFL